MDKSPPEPERKLPEALSRGKKDPLVEWREATFACYASQFDAFALCGTVWSEDGCDHTSSVGHFPDEPQDEQALALYRKVLHERWPRRQPPKPKERVVVDPDAWRDVELQVMASCDKITERVLSHGKSKIQYCSQVHGPMQKALGDRFRSLYTSSTDPKILAQYEREVDHCVRSAALRRTSIYRPCLVPGNEKGQRINGRWYGLLPGTESAGD